MESKYKPGDTVRVDEFRYGEIVKRRKDGWLVEFDSGAREICCEYEMELVEEKIDG